MNLYNFFQPQTPKQRHANEMYAMREAAKRGKSKIEKPVSEKKKLGISIYWAYLLIFLAVGGAMLETLYMLLLR
ncbi:uncharacterized protein T551_00827 [Pneumocystis jirovecii RU7]|uniref:Stress-associated endoplasmic reticulum protein n=1 Tax=Pneumocystis jirovecii (strain RU7) TaxID=1408657 RepID=A0A0W4ZUU0_PNEJ7|nr:uncharacterized protein T551_00827 [Pneumocystis jirovecii RU7]KTW32145.1 hypothetical protein T551_00827 [Pneumocystis jirovecii RU7]